MKGVIIQKQHPVVVEESFSNLTTDVSLSNSSHQDGCNMLLQHQYFAPPTQNQPAVKKKKRNLPGNPDPDSEVIALSPKALLATNRFVCEVCKKGFQRDQNLQLHRRGHNLPWKLKQRTVGKDAVRKKVYVCPEPGCVHHDPARALGDLTGIKKHFCRKHGEKKWKCDKCSKRYAVQSDWKAHSKTCGTREYRCDCGTLFSRRDSFITHRAFCDALAEENGRAITGNIPVLPSQSNSNGHPFPLLKNEQQDYYFSPRQPQILPPWLPSPQQQQQVSALGLGGHGPPIFSSSSSRSDHHHHHQVFKPHESSNPNPTHGPTIPPPPHMSATALLQKAAQMGVTMRSSTPPAAMTMLDGTHQAHVSADSGKVTTGFALNLNPPPAHIASGFGGSLSFFGNKAANTENDAGTGAGTGAHPCLVQEMIMANSLDQSATGFDGRCSFEEEENAFGGALEEAEGTRHHQYSSSSFSSRVDNAMEIGVFGGHGNDSMTRDFLGLRAAISNGDIFSIPGFNTSMNTTSKELQNSWQG